MAGTRFSTDRVARASFRSVHRQLGISVEGHGPTAKIICDRSEFRRLAYPLSANPHAARFARRILLRYVSLNRIPASNFCRRRFNFDGPLDQALHAASSEVRRVAIARCID